MLRLTAQCHKDIRAERRTQACLDVKRLAIAPSLSRPRAPSGAIARSASAQLRPPSLRSCSHALLVKERLYCMTWSSTLRIHTSCASYFDQPYSQDLERRIRKRAPMHRRMSGFPACAVSIGVLIAPRGNWAPSSARDGVHSAGADRPQPSAVTYNCHSVVEVAGPTAELQA